MTDCPQFGVVEFLSDNTVEAVPYSWLFVSGNEETMCYWPNTDRKTTTQLLNRTDTSTPDSTWDVYEIKIKGSSDEYLLARQLAKELEFTSNLDTGGEDNVPRKRKRKTKKISNAVSSRKKHKSLNIPSTDLFGEKEDNYNCLPLQFPLSNERNELIENNCSYDVDDFQNTSGINTNCFKEPSVLPQQNTAQPIIVYDQTNIPKQIESLREEFKGYVQLILRKLTSLENEVHELVRKSNSNDTSIENEIPISKLPLATEAELRNLNSWIEQDEHKQALITFLSKIGGENITRVTSRILNKVISKVGKAHKLRWKIWKNKI